MDNIATMSAAELVRRAEETAVQLTRDKLKTGQIRNFYSAITRIRTDFVNADATEDSKERKELMDKIRTDIIMLKPKIAYAAGRQTAVRATFYPFVKGAIDGIEKSNFDNRSIKNFLQLVESVVAYHKFYGGD